MFERIKSPNRIRSEGEEIKYRRRKEERKRHERRGQDRKDKQSAYA